MMLNIRIYIHTHTHTHTYTHTHTGGSPPKFLWIELKYKKFGGEPPVPPIASHGLPSFILYQGWPANYFGYSRYFDYSRFFGCSCYFGYSRYSRTLTTTLSASSRTLTTNALSLLSSQPHFSVQLDIYIVTVYSKYTGALIFLNNLIGTPFNDFI